MSSSFRTMNHPTMNNPSIKDRTMKNVKKNLAENPGRESHTARPVRPIVAIAATVSTTLMLGLLLGGCGPDFDPASLVKTTRIVGARVEVDGAPDRAEPAPGEHATVTWLVTAPGALPPLGWAFALCAPGTVGGKPSLGCQSVPLAVFQGTESPPRVSIVVPARDALGTAQSLILYGEICDGAGSMPTFDPDNGIPRSTGGSAGTTASVSIALQLQPGEEANHNPTAERAFTFEGQLWGPPMAGDDPCLVGPRVSAGTNDHVIGTTTLGTDRESYIAMLGDPPVPTASRESLQISQFTTAGELKSAFSFVEAEDTGAETTAEVKWKAPKTVAGAAAGQPVTFTFVVRDNRGGIDWTTRAACVVP